jgi:hypothetical protein
MNDSQEILVTLRDEFQRWEELLATLTEEQLTTPMAPSHLSIKDVVAHLRAWQQVSIARLEAARLDTEPVFPDWLEGSDPESEEEREEFNTRIYERYRELPTSRVHQEWKSGFLKFLELGQAIPADVLLDIKKYAWLKGYALFDVLQGSFWHHEEHRDQLPEK